MTCDLCGTKSSEKPSYSSRNYCKKHFREFIIKRIRKDLRTQQKLDISKKYHVEVKEDKDRFLKEILQEIFGKQLQWDTKGKEISTETLEEYASRVFEEFLRQKKHETTITPLRKVNSEDLQTLGIRHQATTHPLLAELESKKAGSLFSLVNILER